MKQKCQIIRETEKAVLVQSEAGIGWIPKRIWDAIVEYSFDPEKLPEFIKLYPNELELQKAQDAWKRKEQEDWEDRAE